MTRSSMSPIPLRMSSADTDPDGCSRAEKVCTLDPGWVTSAFGIAAGCPIQLSLAMLKFWPGCFSTRLAMSPPTFTMPIVSPLGAEPAIWLLPCSVPAAGTSSTLTVAPSSCPTYGANRRA